METDINHDKVPAAPQDKQTLESAIQTVTAKIAEMDQQLSDLANQEGSDTSMLYGRTASGKEAAVRVDSSGLAKILLRHDYSVYHVLRLDYPDSMWTDLARYVGLDEVYGLDL